MLRFAIPSASSHVFSETLQDNLSMAHANRNRKPHRVRRRLNLLAVWPEKYFSGQSEARIPKYQELVR